MTKDLVVVESPTKAKSIGKYLGPDYEVVASGGHVRDLLDEETAVDPDNDFAMVWRRLDNKKKYLDDIVRQVRGAERIILATDPDREGEAISWHLVELLGEAKLLAKKPVQRVVFHEITKRAVLDAMAQARNLDDHLIDAYRARRALDHLVGFRLSPVLWRKLPGARSAGRVQSVALRLICEREAEIEAFRPREYWTVEALLATEAQARFTSRLVGLDGKKLERFSLADEAAARRAVAAVEAASLLVRAVEKKQVSRNPSPPFSTSTLQQEASRKLGFGARRTMQTAQALFEGVELGGETVGLITYMRTDSISLSGEAIGAARDLIGQRFGQRYLPDQPRQYRTKAKNAQEAHEAIRPTDFARLPQEIAGFLGADERRLYELIWQRAVASQMAAALLDRVAIDIGDAQDGVALRATGQTIAFDGFLKLYQEGRDDRPRDGEEEEGDDRLLPPMREGSTLRQHEVKPHQHFTEPPPRFTEASLVKKLEELGIGRPSTYATIISVLQDRDYVRLEQKRFVPEDRGRLVTAFLTSFFDRWMQPTFTADLEDKLDDVAAGDLPYQQVLREFWDPFKGRLDEVMERRLTDVIDRLNEALAPTLFPPRADGSDPRRCPKCDGGTLSLKLGKSGAFIGCSNYPECRYTRNIGAGEQAVELPKMLGVDPASSEEVWLKNGKYGPYLQRGTGDSVRFSSLPPGYAPADVNLDTALRILALPREIGQDPNTSQPVEALLNRYGAFVQSGPVRRKLDADDDVLTVGLNRALAILAEPAKKGERPATARPPSQLKELGPHPDDKKPVKLSPTGRFGPYVVHGKLFASLPKGVDPDEIGLERALELLRAKAAKDAAKGKGGAAKSAQARTAARPGAGKPATAKAAKVPAAKSADKAKPPANVTRRSRAPVDGGS